MKDKYFKLFKWVIVIWSALMIISFILVAVLSHLIAEQWFNQYYANNTIINKSIMKLYNNGTDYKVIYNLTHNFGNEMNNNQKDNRDDREAIKETFKCAFIIVVIISAVIGVFFNIIGLIGSFKEVYCLSLTYAIYTTLVTIILFINSITFPIEWIIAVKYCFMTGCAYAFAAGLKERKYHSSGIGVISYDQQNILTNNNENGLNIQKKIYPTQQLFKADPPNATPYAPPPSVFPPPATAPPLTAPTFDYPTAAKF